MTHPTIRLSRAGRVIVLVGFLGLALFTGGCALLGGGFGLGIDPEAIKATQAEIRELEVKEADPKTPPEEKKRLRRRIDDLETGLKIPKTVAPDSGH
ncbi:MAG: hypothetical protein AABZ70_11635 [candidate division NC10 bacterium]